MVENDEITGTMKGDSDSDLVSDFIGIFFISINAHVIFLNSFFFRSLLQGQLRDVLTSLLVAFLLFSL